jgi:signal transduction histidine kinase
VVANAVLAGTVPAATLLALAAVVDRPLGAGTLAWASLGCAGAVPILETVGDRRTQEWPRRALAGGFAPLAPVPAATVAAWLCGDVGLAAEISHLTVLLLASVSLAAVIAALYWFPDFDSESESGLDRGGDSVGYLVSVFGLTAYFLIWPATAFWQLDSLGHLDPTWSRLSLLGTVFFAVRAAILLRGYERARRDLLERVRTLSLLADFHQRAQGLTEPRAVIEAGVRAAGRILRAPTAVLLVPANLATEVLVRASTNPELPPGATITDESASYVRDAMRGAGRLWPADIRFPESKLASGAVMPVLDSGFPIGLLAVFSPRPRAFQTEDLTTLRVITFAIGVAINQQQALDEVRQGDKLEAIGRLAAGMAHEINTPIQFITDNLRFMNETVTAINEVLAGYRQLQTVAEPAGVGARLAELRRQETRVDLDFLITELPAAAHQALSGAERVTGIVQALRSFSHPDATEVEEIDLNQLIRTTVLMAGNEFKQVADVITELEELPPYGGFVGDLHHALLNIVINAAHAVTERFEATQRRGQIYISSRVAGGQIEIEVSDTGPGMSDEVRQKIFDPFFTTKPQGQGSGQGLYQARAAIERHHGSIRVRTKPGAGTTFVINLPLHE